MGSSSAMSSRDLIEEMLSRFADDVCGNDCPVYRDGALSLLKVESVMDLIESTPPESWWPTNLFASVRDLLLQGLDPDLEFAFANSCSRSVSERLAPFIISHADDIVALMRSRHVQTNEVARAALLAPALAYVQDRTERALGVLEVGASAGFNLMVDSCGIDYGTIHVERAGRLQLSCRHTGAPLPSALAKLQIEWRRGIDRAPVNLDHLEEARWLRACVWPDQRQREQRLNDAIALWRQLRPAVERGDAVRDVGQMVARVPDDLALVVVTSWMNYYLDEQQRADFEVALASAGREVTWVSLEYPLVVPGIAAPRPPTDGGVTPSVLAEVRFNGASPRSVSRSFLGWGHQHGEWLHWDPQSPAVD
jgi:hypothetical protein